METGDMQFQLGESDSPALTDWKEEPSLSALRGDLDAAKAAHDAQLAKINRWTDLLEVTGSAKPTKVKGRSEVQPKLIRRQAEWRYSALSEPFLSSDKLFKVSPVTFEDEAGARQNELMLNYQFRTKLDRVFLIDNVIRATVDEGTCIARLGWKRCSYPIKKRIPIYEYLPIQTEEELAPLQQALLLLKQNPRGYNETIPLELQAAVLFFMEEGKPTIARQVGEEEVEEEYVTDNHPTVEVLNPANVYIDPSCNGELSKALFVIVTFETNKAELLKETDRYKNLDKVNWESSTALGDENYKTSVPETFKFRDAARKKVVAYEYWGFYDIQGDGKLEPIVATWIGNTLIRMELNPFPDEQLPFVTIPYLPVKRELYGEPDAELLEDNQRILGAVSRGMIDLMARSANGQQGFAKGMLDPLNRRRMESGQDYEFNPNMPPNQGLIEHRYPEIPNSAMLMLNLQNQEAEALTGVKSFYGGVGGNAYGNVAAGIRGMLDAASKREMAILRRIAKGISEIGRKIIAMNAEFLSDTEVVRVTNAEFVEIKREDLKGNYDLQVDISTFEVDNEKAQDLGFMLQTLGPNMDPGVTMKILSEIAELKRMPVLAQQLRTWQPPPPDPVQQQMQQMELMKLQLEMKKLESEVALNMAKAQQATTEANLTELDRIETETGTKHARKIIEQQAQAKGNQNLEITKSLLKARKPGESAPSIDAAIGYNTMMEAMQEESLRGSPQLTSPPQDPNLNPNQNF